MGKMEDILRKLNLKDQKRIVVLNADKSYLKKLKKSAPDLQIDTEIDPRFPYEIMLIFVKDLHEVNEITPSVIHNLVCNGIIWFAYPRTGDSKNGSDLDRKHGWEILLKRGFDSIRHVNIDEKWAAVKFKNAKYIKSRKALVE